MEKNKREREVDMLKLDGYRSIVPSIPPSHMTPEIAYKQNISWIVNNSKELKKRYGGKWVLVRNREVIDSSKDRFELGRRLSKKHSPELITLFFILE